MNKERLEQLMANMNDEQLAELRLVLDILDQSEPECKIRFNGRMYYSYIVKIQDNADRFEMRLIVGMHGLLFCPADKDIAECLLIIR